MARETLKDFLNRQGSAADKISVTLKEGDDGIGIDPNTEKELLELDDSATGLLGNYLKFIMEEEGNQFLPEEGNSKLEGSQRGKHLTPADNHGFSDNFINSADPLNQKLQEYSNSGYFTPRGLRLAIDKLGSGLSEENSGHNILKSVEGSPLDKSGKTLVNPIGEDNPVVRASKSQLLRNNRFANVGSQKSKAFAESPQDVAQFEEVKETTEGSMSIQTEFGNYDKEQNIVNIDQLKSLGASLLAKASGFDGGSNPENSLSVEAIKTNIETNPSSNKIYSIESGFTGVEFRSLRSQNAKGFPSNETTGESVREGKGNWIEDDPDADSTKSFGATYNSEFQFHNRNINLHKTQAAISMIAVKAIGKTFYENFIDTLRDSDKINLSNTVEAFAIENDKGDILNYAMGKSTKLASTKLDYNIFSNVLTNTTYSYGNSVNRGLQVIYGAPNSKIESNDPDSVKNSKNIAQSPGYWIAVSRSVLKSLDGIYSRLNDITDFSNLDSNELFLIYKEIIDSNKFIQFFNVMAVIGDISLTSGNGYNGGLEYRPDNARDVDKISDNRSIPGKSRSKNGAYKEELSWSQDAAQSMYLLPANIIRAAVKLNHTQNGENPARAMFGSKLVKSTYTGIGTDGSYARIPNNVVKAVEDHLEAEYVPFYMHDLRTNEIISFNAFLSQLTDSINPQYTSSPSYGRLDPVQTYSGTTRSLQVAFVLYATNREDFDMMWYKINKFVTLLYPQWTPGTMVSNTPGSKFYQPFSQVIGGTPIVRMRIGDVIKSNYSKFGLARTFGIGDTDVVPLNESSLGGGVFGSIANLGRTGAKLTSDLLTELGLKTWLTTFGSPLSTIGAIGDAIGRATGTTNTYANISKAFGANAIDAVAASAINSGIFANPLAVNDVINQIVDPNKAGDTLNIDKYGYRKGALRKYYLKPNVINGYLNAKTGEKYLVTKKIKVRVLEKKKFSELSSDIPLTGEGIGYLVQVVDDINVHNQRPPFEAQLVVKHTDIYPDPKLIFNASYTGLALAGLGIDVASGVDTLFDNINTGRKLIDAGLDIGGRDLIKSIIERSESSFMRPENNPFVRAFSSTKGRGIAGVVKSVSFDWMSDFPWETDFNSKAPIGCKISFGFDVIHDLPPGLDHTGYNKAPLYNVGNIMKNISGDVYHEQGDNGKLAEDRFYEDAYKTNRVKNGVNDGNQ